MLNELFLRFPDFKIRAVTMSFDDGHFEDRRIVEEFDKWGIKGTFNLDLRYVMEKENKIPVQEYAELYKNHEVASHTLTHPHLDSMDDGGVAYEVVKSREMLEELIARPVVGFAYPYGLSERAGMVDCVKKCGVSYARTTNDTRGFSLPTDFMRWNPTCHQAYKGFGELVEKFFAPEDTAHPWRITPRLFYIWGHSYEFRDNWEWFENICQAVGSKENVWYATNIEIYDYITAFKALRRSANGKYIYNPTDKDVFVWVNRKNIVLEKGKTTVLE